MAHYAHYIAELVAYSTVSAGHAVPDSELPAIGEPLEAEILAM